MDGSPFRFLYFVGFDYTEFYGFVASNLFYAHSRIEIKRRIRSFKTVEFFVRPNRRIYRSNHSAAIQLAACCFPAILPIGARNAPVFNAQELLCRIHIKSVGVLTANVAGVFVGFLYVHLINQPKLAAARDVGKSSSASRIAYNGRAEPHRIGIS